MSKTVEVDTRTFVRFWLVVAVLGLAVMLIGQAATGLLIVGLAIFLAAAVRPLMKKVEKIIGPDKPGLAAGLTVGGLVLILGVVIAVVGPTVVSETTEFLKTVPEQLQSESGGIGEAINNVGKFFGISDAKAQVVASFRELSQNIISNLGTNVLSSVSAISSFLSGLVLTLVIAILWLIQGPELMNSLWKKIDSKSSHKTATVSRRVVDRMAGVISKYVSGQALVAVLDGIAVGVLTFVLSLIFGFSAGLSFPMALIAMIFYLIPMFGPLLTCIVVVPILFFSSPIAAIIFLVVYVVYEQIENNIISPKVQGNALDLPSVIILIAITIGIYMFGLLGAIISIPIAGMIKVLIDEYPNIRALRES